MKRNEIEDRIARTARAAGHDPADITFLSTVRYGILEHFAEGVKGRHELDRNVQTSFDVPHPWKDWGRIELDYLPGLARDPDLFVVWFSTHESKPVHLYLTFDDTDLPDDLYPLYADMRYNNVDHEQAVRALKAVDR